jgi:DedD protein
MSRKQKQSTSPTFFRFLGWTVVLALVFTLGLITGERYLRVQSLPRLDPYPQASNPPPSADTLDKKQTKKPTRYSFYDTLGSGPVGKVGSRASASKQAARPAAPVKVVTRKPKPVAKVAAVRPKVAPKIQVKPRNATPSYTKKVRVPVLPEIASNSADAEKQEPKTAEKQKALPFDEQKGPADIEPTVAPTAASDEQADSGGKQTKASYTLQIGSHATADLANREANRLQSKGLKAVVTKASVPGTGVVFRVQLGQFNSMNGARGVQKEIDSKHALRSFVRPL